MADHELLEAIELLNEHGADLDVASICGDLDCDDPAIALAAYFDTTEVVDEGNDEWTVAGCTYLVLTDDEADARLDEYLEQLLDEPGMVPGADSPYFDREAWKSDAKMDGRGHYLAGYDGDEIELNHDLYAYRVN